MTSETRDSLPDLLIAVCAVILAYAALRKLRHDRALAWEEGYIQGEIAGVERHEREYRRTLPSDSAD